MENLYLFCISTFSLSSFFSLNSAQFVSFMKTYKFYSIKILLKVINLTSFLSRPFLSRESFIQETLFRLFLWLLYRCLFFRDILLLLFYLFRYFFYFQGDLFLIFISPPSHSGDPLAIAAALAAHEAKKRKKKVHDPVDDMMPTNIR